MTILAAISLLIQLLPDFLQALNVTTPAMTSLIEQLAAAIPGLISNLSSGKGVPSEVTTVLSAFQAELVTLQQNDKLSPQALALATTLTHGIANALASYQAAAVIDDPSSLTPLPTNLTEGAAPVVPEESKLEEPKPEETKPEESSQGEYQG